MIKIKTALLGSALAVALSGPAMAEDFHALAGLQGATPLQDGVLAATEGGAACDVLGVTADSGAPGGVCLIALLPPAAFFSVTNELPVTAAQFLQVHGFAEGTFPTGNGP